MNKFLILASLSIIFFTGCAEKTENQPAEEVKENHVVLVLSQENVLEENDKFKEFMQKIIEYTSEPNNQVDMVLFSGIDAKNIMTFFQQHIDFQTFPQNIRVLSIDGEGGPFLQIENYDKYINDNKLPVYKLTIFGEKYSEDEALVAANNLYNDYVQDEIKQKMKGFLEEWKDADFETQKTQLHILKDDRDFSKQFFSETPELSYREFNLLIPEEQKAEVIDNFYDNTVEYLK
ncbi:MAG: hypothetical protein ABH835_02730 [Patescibacteria group bacterium]